VGKNKANETVKSVGCCKRQSLWDSSGGLRE
jgi:hypothetical protein